MRLVLFDLDGVLLDSKDNMRLAWAAVQDHGVACDVPFDRYFAEIGRPFREIMIRLGVAEVDLAEKVFRDASLQHVGAYRFFPGIRDALQEIAGRAKIGIVTSKDETRTLAALSLLPVHFDTVQTPASGVRGKPAPDQLLLAMAHAGVDPMQTIYVGDMPVDFEAAQRAGCKYAQAFWGYGSVNVGHVLLGTADIAFLG